MIASAVVPAEVADRGMFMQHDMFQQQPVRDADVYFFRGIFQNSDKYCVELLQATIPALKLGARIVIKDACMPPHETLPPAANRAKRCVHRSINDFLQPSTNSGLLGNGT